MLENDGAIAAAWQEKEGANASSDECNREEVKVERSMDVGSDPMWMMNEGRRSEMRWMDGCLEI